LNLPAGYTAYPQSGPDFDVYWLIRLTGPEEGRSRMGIYIGNHPQARSAPATARAVTSKVFGHEATWFEWEDSNGDARGETFVAGLGQSERSGHLFIYASSAADREVFLRTIASGQFD
jgi:hypothetical protein